MTTDALVTREVAARPDNFGFPAPTLVGCLAWLNTALDVAFEAAADLDALPAELADLVSRVEQVRSRTDALRLKVVSKADAANAAAGAGDTATSRWLVRHTHIDPAQAGRDVRLADALATRAHTPTNRALDAGTISAEHAAVIVKAMDALPEAVPHTERAKVEERLVSLGSHRTPRELRKEAVNVLAGSGLDRHLADQHADTQVRGAEKDGRAAARFAMWDNSDGTVSGNFTVPTLAGAILRKTIEQLTSPRRSDAVPSTPEERKHQAGLAFASVLERLPTDRLGDNVAATVVVTVQLDQLRAALGAASLDTGEFVSASSARRLACEAGILPAVLGGLSVPLDLGRSQRTFNASQRLALATLYATCAADGCDRPYAWCELHHEIPWGVGGPTDLGLSIPLCSKHHHLVHSPAYDSTVTTSALGKKSVSLVRRA